jgi:hypothetical protein
MATRIKTTGKKGPRVKVTSPRGQRVPPEQVAAALGADKVPGSVRSQSPDTLAAVRQEIVHRLSSSGGRPSLKGTSRRQKIPLDDEDWERLRQIADALRDDEVRPTAGQVASVLLHRTLAGLDLESATAELRRAQQDDGGH